MIPDTLPADESATTSAKIYTDGDDSLEIDKSDVNGTAAITADDIPPSASVYTTMTPSSSSTYLTTPSPRNVRDHAGNSIHYHYSPKVVYGGSTVSRLPTELGRLHLVCPLIVSSPSCINLARRIQGLIPNLDSRLLNALVVNSPQHVTDDAVFRITGGDCVISVGSTLAVALASSITAHKDIPHICIPTTYSGSEHMTQAYTRRLERMESRGKRCTNSSKSPQKSPESDKSPSSSTDGNSRQRSMKPRPTVIIYDENLTATDTLTHISAPNDGELLAKSHDCSSKDNENAQWSYLHLHHV